MSKIQWTEQTWNPLAGCGMVSPGCRGCYAMAMAHRLAAMGQKKYAGTTVKKNGRVVWTGKVNTDEAALQIPLRRKKPTMWFVNSMSDLFHEAVPYEFIDKVFAVMNATIWKLPLRAHRSPQSWHTYQVLTKRPRRAAEYLASRCTSRWSLGKHPLFAAGRGEGGPLRGHGPSVMNSGACLSWPLPNVWLGVSVEDQKTADERIPILLQCPAAVRWVSYEPALEQVDFLQAGAMMASTCFCGTPWKTRVCVNRQCHERTGSVGAIDWIVIGGESGPKSRPFDVDWARSVVRQCKDADVACFLKQLGANVIQRPAGCGVPIWSGNETIIREPTQLEFKHPKGGDPSEWSEDLRIREWPDAAKT